MDVDRCYFDTSYLVRFYLRDAGFDAVRQLAASVLPASARHGRLEVVAALHRALREGRIKQDGLRQALEQFEQECRSGALHWLILTEAVFSRAERILTEAPATTFLRAADALHLGCAAENGFTEIYSHDRHLLAAASLFGLRGVNVILSP